MKLTIFFNGQYWEGVVELAADDRFQAGRHIFGAEPQAAEVLEFVVNNQVLQVLAQSTAAIDTQTSVLKRVNPKRIARQVSKEMAMRSGSTMAQEVIKQSFEQQQQMAKQQEKIDRDIEAEEKWLRSRQKAKARHRGKA